MKDIWYGDDKDIVKWASLVHLARSTEAASILQVLLYRPTGVRPPEVTLDGNPIAFPTEVWTHFRTTAGIAGLSSVAGINIVRFTDLFAYANEHGNIEAARTAYFNRVADRIKALGQERAVVFLDPDNGFSPQNTGWAHVTLPEVTAIFQAVKPGDTVAVYQHNPHQPNWVETARGFLSQATSLPPAKVNVLRAAATPDVAMLAITK